MDREELLRAGVAEAHALGRRHRHQRAAERARAVRDRTAAGSAGGRDAAGGGAVRRRTSPSANTAKRRKQGRIPIVPDAEGNNSILVDVWEHPHPMAERLRRQVTEGAHHPGRREGPRWAAERRTSRWTSTCGPTCRCPSLARSSRCCGRSWRPGSTALMLATGGVWLESIPHAVKAYKGLFTVDGLKSARKEVSGVFLIGIPISRTPSPRSSATSGPGKGSGRAAPSPLLDLTATRAWLEERLGPLAMFEVEGDEVATLGVTTGRRSHNRHPHPEKITQLHNANFPLTHDANSLMTDLETPAKLSLVFGRKMGCVSR